MPCSSCNKKACSCCGKAYKVGARGPGLANHLRKNPGHQGAAPKQDRVRVQSKGTHR